jgi:hypothetical protein
MTEREKHYLESNSLPSDIEVWHEAAGRANSKCNILGWHDPSNRALYFYKLIPAQAPVIQPPFPHHIVETPPQTLF